MCDNKIKIYLTEIDRIGGGGGRGGYICLIPRRIVVKKKMKHVSQNASDFLTS
jgi:hypothetical protein